MEKETLKIGEYGPIYTQFKDKPKEAILHLIKVKQGECKNALYREDIGFISLIWGENHPETHKGFGLKHIIEKHGKDIEFAGFSIVDFIPLVVRFGNFNLKRSETGKRVYDSESFRCVVACNGEKQWLLTAFIILKKPKAKP
ncbi:MAG: hypothetical protein FWE63_05780 [Bacteroidales bacterium]|nr:hypothetical protein [Bacteroidales bacterium]